MLSGLQTFLERRPLPTLEVLREELAERTIDYHFLGYPHDPWMTSVTSLWLSVQDMHRQERLLRWEQETLPRLLQLRGSLESAEGDLAVFSRRFGMVT